MPALIAAGPLPLSRSPPSRRPSKHSSVREKSSNALSSTPGLAALSLSSTPALAALSFHAAPDLAALSFHADTATTSQPRRAAAAANPTPFSTPALSPLSPCTHTQAHSTAAAANPTANALLHPALSRPLPFTQTQRHFPSPFYPFTHEVSKNFRHSPWIEGKKPTMDTSNKIIPGYEDEIQSPYSSEVEEDKEEEELKHELADVTFEELQKARSSGFHSTTRMPALESRPRRANKNRPMEMSSKKPVGRFREVIQAPKKVARDPRFESLCGTLDSDGFRKRYNFLFEVDLPAEREKLQKLIKKSKDPKVIEEGKTHISWIDKQLKSGPAKSADAKFLAEHKKKEREAAKQGKRPFYLKKSEIRERKLIEKYNQLKATGKLDAFIEKRRKRNAAKDRRYMPYRRAHDNE